MKRFKLILNTIILVFTACIMTGCDNNGGVDEDTNKKVEEKSVARTLTKQFKEEIKNEKDIEKVAASIAKNEVLEIEVDVAAMKKEDYISGFQTEIKGFDKVVTIRPFIGTIPFLAYIFEVDDAEAFAEKLKSNADLRWNICTEADDMEVAVVDHYVFFVMAPKSFEQE